MAIAAVGLRVFYWVYADRVWEDALITILHAENVFAGIGLTHYRPGEMPIHGFTSPLSVLVPLAGEALHRGWAIGAIRVVSALAGGAAVLLAFRFGLPRTFACLWAALLGFSHDQIHWGMAGMETQIATTALIWSMAVWREDRGKWIEGLAIALCVYARPDFALWGAIACLFRPRAILPAAAMYLPWVIFTTLYYGSPIPNTILAKSAAYPTWLSEVRSLEQGAIMTYEIMTRNLYITLGPTWGGHGAGGFRFLWDSGWISKFMMFAVGLGVLRWRREYTPVYLMLAVYTLYYLFLVPVIFLWYCIPLTAVAGLIAAYGLSTLFMHRVGALLAAAYAASLLYTLPFTFHGERAIQTYIENGIRRKMGEDMGRLMTLEDSVVCEPLGYTGYYSRRVIYDYPGLCSRKVVAFYKREKPERSLFPLVKAFRPPFLLLRPREIKAISERPDGGFLNEEYQVFREYRLKAEDYAKIPLIELNIDTDFLLLKKVK